MKRIGNIRVIQKIQCECCKKIYFSVGKQSNVHAQVLSCINNYLYKAENSAEAILSETEKLRIHVEDNHKGNGCNRRLGYRDAWIYSML